VDRQSRVGRGPLSAGTGLVSMNERASLLGGQVTAGLDGDVWRVDATLPLGARP
jgi:signal transduction histidine kinase